ncbi:uncharacterized protein AMSG_11588 [Thecamonas trahens ATCC 50062]|uniref:Calcium uniporter protein C-terminal domain-containing protein n=1 Tax=Thecamonas trahens ATCC 50062 TaxID=461836 RepID=A0A0L0D117_THETB|nr:hypothetical protein AMSG_11588 [Thecamonas trahens ATCC 50062]KNC45921.1 hypothetical protein AMSG_11588 [Thecamonas trahens ATCC 50062]|eukprot:XP_013763186.1 hypothetical protein AMSG_11588 [Thecamonas trahens ATCC 50062]
MFRGGLVGCVARTVACEARRGGVAVPGAGVAAGGAGWRALFSGGAAASVTSGETELVLNRDGTSGRVTLPLPDKPCSFYLTPQKTLGEVAEAIVAESPNISEVHFETEASPGAAAKVAEGTRLEHILPSPIELRLAYGPDGLREDLLGDPLYISINGERTRILPVVDHRRGGALTSQADAGEPSEFADYDRILATVRDKAEVAGQTDMDVDEFYGLCEELGVSRDEAGRVLSCMHGAGQVLYFEDEPHMRNTIFLKPELVSQELRKSLRIRTLQERDWERDRRATIINLLVDRLQPLVDTKAALDTQAYKHARRVMWGGWVFSAGQLAFIARLTWWEFSWDVMEPISYVMGVANVALFSFLFQFRGVPVDSYSSLQKYVQEKKAAKLYKKHGFDEDEYAELRTALDFFEQEEADDLTSQELIDVETSRHDQLR